MKKAVKQLVAKCVHVWEFVSFKDGVVTEVCSKCGAKLVIET